MRREIQGTHKARKAAYAVFFLVGAALFALAIGGAALAQPGTVSSDEVLPQGLAGTIKILPTSASVLAGDTITVEVWLEDVGDYWGLDFKLRYEKAKVSIPSGEVNPLWEVFDEDSHFTIANEVTTLDDTYNEVQYALVNLNNSDPENPTMPFTGTGRVCSITFSGLAEGITSLEFTYAKGSTSEEGLFPAQEDGSLSIVHAFSMTLAAGWNLVSFPLDALAENPRDLLSPVSANYDLVYHWNGATQTWESFLQMLPDPQTLTSLDLTEGFWIHMLADDVLDIHGSTPVQTPIDLHSGWNMVGFPAGAPRPVDTALASIAGKFSLVFEFDPADATDPWALYDANAPAFANDLTTLRPGMGYWIKATEPCAWVVPY